MEALHSHFLTAHGTWQLPGVGDYEEVLESGELIPLPAPPPLPRAVARTEVMRTEVNTEEPSRSPRRWEAKSGPVTRHKAPPLQWQHSALHRESADGAQLHELRTEQFVHPARNRRPTRNPDLAHFSQLELARELHARSLDMPCPHCILFTLQGGGGPVVD